MAPILPLPMSRMALPEIDVYMSNFFSGNIQIANLSKWLHFPKVKGEPKLVILAEN
jgi:hypothetical protein